MGDQHGRTDTTGPGTLAIMIATLAGVVATVAISAFAWHFFDRPVAELPGWIEAGATAAAVGAAIVAGFYAARAYGLEHQRERRWEDTQRSAQASRVAAWPDHIVYRTEPFRGDDGYISPKNVAIKGVVVHVRNASDLPIERVVVSILVVIPTSLFKTDDYASAVASHVRVPPETTVDVYCAMKDGELSTSHFGEMEPELNSFIQFVDAAGRTWSRASSQGELTEGRSPIL